MISDERRLRFFVVLATLHSALLVASNAAGAKIIALPVGLTASATVIPYMISFIVLSAIAELYGREYSKLVIHIGLGALVVSVVFLELAILLPPAPFWTNQTAFVSVLGSTWRILLGGWSAYMVSQYLDLWGFFRIKDTAWGAKLLWLRALGGVLIGQLVDTVIFMTIAFGGVFPLLSAIEGQYLIKLVFAAVATPLVYVAVGVGRRYFKVVKA